jgi:MFS family permease
MSQKYRILALMTVAQAGASIVQQAVGVLAPFLIMQFGVNDAQLGSLFTSLYFGSAAFTAFSGMLTDRLGERTMVAVSGSVMSIALVLAVLVPSYPWLVGCLALFGAGYAGSMPAGGRAILAWFDRDRGIAMGIRQTGVPVGGLLGAVVLPLTALHFGGYRAALLVAAALVALPTLLVFVIYKESSIDRPPPSTPAEMLAGMHRLARDPRLIVVTLTCMSLVVGQLAMNGFLTVTAIQVVHVSQAAASAAFAAAFAAATVARLFWGWYSDKYMRESRIMLLGGLSAFGAVASLAIALVSPALSFLLIPAALALGFFGAGWNGVMAAALAEIGGADRAASAIGLTLTAIFTASAIGPLVFGSIADHSSLDTAWSVNAAVGVLGVLPVLWLRRHERLKQAAGTAQRPRYRDS